MTEEYTPEEYQEKRERFALMTMQTLLLKEEFTGAESLDNIVYDSVEAADRLLKQLKRTPNQCFDTRLGKLIEK